MQCVLLVTDVLTCNIPQFTFTINALTFLSFLFNSIFKTPIDHHFMSQSETTIVDQRNSSVPNFAQNQVLIRSPSTAVHVDMDDLQARDHDVEQPEASAEAPAPAEPEHESEPRQESEHESEHEPEPEAERESEPDPMPETTESSEEPPPPPKLSPEQRKAERQAEARNRLAKRSMDLAMRSKERLERARKQNEQNSPKKEDPEATGSPRKFTSSLPGYLTEVVSFAQQHQVRVFRQSANEKM